jgi:hypothetical protein
MEAVASVAIVDAEEFAEIEAGVQDYAETLLRRLIRLAAMPRNRMPEGVRRRAIFWAYTDCVDVGLKAKADYILSTLIGKPEQRENDAVELGAGTYDPNVCVCGHAGLLHRMAGLGTRAGCNDAGGCKCSGFDNAPRPANPQIGRQPAIAPPLPDPDGPLGQPVDPMDVEFPRCVCGCTFLAHDPGYGACVNCQPCAYFFPQTEDWGEGWDEEP